MRRWKFSLLLLALAILLVARPVDLSAQDSSAQRRHGFSLLGELKYPEGFKHYDYADPATVKGGRVRMGVVGTFDSLNPLLYKGNQPEWLLSTYSTLLDGSLDEPASAYCLLCEWMSYAADWSSVTFKLRAGARFHDGKPITAEDVVFSLESARAVNPRYSLYFKNVDRTEVQGQDVVTFRFDKQGNRDLVQLLGTNLPILPKHYWTGKDAAGQVRDINHTTLEAPLGSGPYRIKEVVAGRAIAYERVPDYWAKDLPTQVGQSNFDELRFEYFKDDTPLIEAFKAGQLEYRFENSAKNWATQYNFSAVQDGRVKKRQIRIERVDGMQGYIFNTRRPKLADPRVREAFNLAFDFEWAATNLFFNQYQRTSSYFENSQLKATGKPQGAELALLESVKDKVPPEVFGDPPVNPVNGTPENIRANLGKAVQLLAAAGWQMKGNTLVDAQGQPFTVEFLLDDAAFERITLPYVKSLQRIGIKASIRQVDPAQAKHRTDTFDFDIVVGVFSQSESPGNEQRDYWSSAAADKQGSRNLTGIKNPAVDMLVDRIIAARTKDDLLAATRALDRVLLWSRLVVPHWYAPYERIAYWDMFTEPPKIPSRSVGFPTVWSWNEAKAKQLQSRR